MLSPVVGLLGLLWAIAVRAQDDDLSALDVADQAATVPMQKPTPCPWSVEGSVGAGDGRAAQSYEREWRGSVDFVCRFTWGSSWRLTIADRLDLRRSHLGGDDVNTLKDAFVTWQPTGNQYLDAGRINARLGVANGYRPTDFFRFGAVRSVVSLDPASLRENRQGTVMLRSQTLWSTGSFIALVAPDLGSRRSQETFALDLGATNSSTRWLLAFSQHVRNLEPQFVIYDDDEDGESAGVGANLTGVLTQSAVGYLEWSGARGTTTADHVLGTAGSKTFRSRVAAGVTYTTKRSLSLTLEYDYNGFGLTASQWRELQRSGADALRYRQTILARQDMPSRNALFMQARMEGAFLRQLDADAFVRVNLDDRSRLYWLRLLYHFPVVDLAVQWQRYRGDPISEYGARGGAAWQVVLTYHHR